MRFKNIGVKKGEDVLCVNCYDEILAFYYESARSPESTNLWTSRFLVKLASSGFKSANFSQDQVKNCIIFLLNLFYNDNPDEYHGRGKALEELNDKEKKVLFSLLKSEVS